MKKYSPIRRARPDEDQPRRRNFEPMRRRADRQRPVPAVPIAGPAPPAAPGPVREYPKIELPREQYELLRKLMVTDNQGRPGGIVWEDVVTLFQEMGFELRRGLRNSRGALDFFHPTDELVASQVSNICWRLLTCCQVLRFWVRPGQWCSGIVKMPSLRSAPLNAIILEANISFNRD